MVVKLLNEILLESTDSEPENFTVTPVPQKWHKAFDRLDNNDYVADKPVDWDKSFGKEVSPDVLVAYGIELDKVQRYGVRELWGKGRPIPFDYFVKSKVPAIFVVNIPGKGAFLVDTEGYAYVKYAVKIQTET